MTLILFFIILAILILSHEFGHFIVAKWFGIRVDEFGLGFPPRIFGVKRGETIYSINAIPFGGFVKIWGEDAAPEGEPLADQARSLSAKPRSVQAAVIGAGILCNVLLAWLLFSFGFMVGMPVPGTEASDPALTRVVFTRVVEDSPAFHAGFMPGDEVVELRDQAGVLAAKPTVLEVQEFIHAHGNQEITVVYQRGAGGEPKTAPVVPGKASDASLPAIGVELESIGTARFGFFAAIAEGARLTVSVFVGTFFGFFELVRDMLFGSRSLDAVTGPIGIVGLVGNAALFGFAYLIGLTATISINLAVINLIPFPALDGGRLLFVVIEAIKRSPISPRLSAGLNTAGFFVLLVFMLVITWNDIAKLFV